MPSGLRIANLHIDHSTNCWATISGAYLKDLTLENVTADADGRFLSLSAWYRGSMSGCNIHILANTNTNDVTRWWFTTAWGSSDVDCVDNTFSADYYAWVHVNEGSVRCRVLRNSITAAPGFNANNQALVNYANRGYSCVIQDNIIRNPSTSPGGAGIRIGASSSWPGLKYRNSVVDGNTIYGGYASIIDNSTTGVTSPRGNVWVP